MFNRPAVVTSLVALTLPFVGCEKKAHVSGSGEATPESRKPEAIVVEKAPEQIQAQMQDIAGKAFKLFGYKVGQDQKLDIFLTDKLDTYKKHPLFNHLQGSYQVARLPEVSDACVVFTKGGDLIGIVQKANPKSPFADIPHAAELSKLIPKLNGSSKSTTVDPTSKNKFLLLIDLTGEELMRSTSLVSRNGELKQGDIRFYIAQTGVKHEMESILSNGSAKQAAQTETLCLISADKDGITRASFPNYLPVFSTTTKNHDSTMPAPVAWQVRAPTQREMEMHSPLEGLKSGIYFMAKSVSITSSNTWSASGIFFNESKEFRTSNSVGAALAKISSDKGISLDIPYRADPVEFKNLEVSASNIQF